LGVLGVQLSTFVFGVFRGYIRWTQYNSVYIGSDFCLLDDIHVHVQYVYNLHNKYILNFITVYTLWVKQVPSSLFINVPPQTITRSSSVCDLCCKVKVIFMQGVKNRRNSILDHPLQILTQNPKQLKNQSKTYKTHNTHNRI
jgi:hypothetical protein